MRRCFIQENRRKFAPDFIHMGQIDIPEKGKLWTSNFKLVFTVNIFSSLAFYLLMIVISGFAIQQYRVSESQAGVATSIFIIGALVARLVFGKRVLKIGCKKTLYIGLILSLVMCLFYLIASGIYPLILVRFLHGFGFGICSTALGTIVALIVPPRRSGEGIGYYGLSQSISTAIGPFLGILFARGGHYHALFLVAAFVMVLGLICTKYLNLPDFRIEDEKSSSFSIRQYIEPGVIPISFISLIAFCCYSTVVSFLSLYAAETGLTAAAKYFFIVYAVAILVSRPITGKLYDRIGENLIMYPTFLLFVLGLLAYALTVSGGWLLFAAALIGYGIGTIQSTTQTISVKLTPRHRLGIANSTFFVLTDIGMGLGPIVAGLLIPELGFRGMYLVFTCLGFMGLFAYHFLHGKKVMKKSFG